MLGILKSLLLVPHTEHLTQSLFGAHREPELSRDGVHLGRAAGNAPGPGSTTLVGAVVGVRHRLKIAESTEIHGDGARPVTSRRATWQVTGTALAHDEELVEATGALEEQREPSELPRRLRDEHSASLRQLHAPTMMASTATANPVRAMSNV
jgi:hypothetical protein